MIAHPQLVQRIDDALPQTQCRRCGYAGCRPYAEAIAHGEADINQCPPGGDATVHALSAITGIGYRPLDAHYGTAIPGTIVRIDETRCIGCTLCLQACPVDAIVGARKFMHTVIADLCTGCELCLPPCPVDCIEIDTAPANTAACAPTLADTQQRRARYEFHRSRLERERQEKSKRHSRADDEQTNAGSNAADNAVANPSADAPAAERISSAVAAAMARAQLRRQQQRPADNTSSAPNNTKPHTEQQ